MTTATTFDASKEIALLQIRIDELKWERDELRDEPRRQWTRMNLTWTIDAIERQIEDYREEL